MSTSSRQDGFSLIELVVALVATALLFVALLPWFTRPLEAMISADDRADATEQVDRALARLALELPTALPNSVRIACGGRCLEFIPVLVQADYRAQTPGDRLDFTIADTAFDVLMPLSSAPAAGLSVVINNLNAAGSGSFSAYSADAANNRGTVAAATTASLIRIAAKQFPSPSLRQRFFIVSTPVSYLCAPAANGGTLRRYAGYAIQSSQPANTALGDLLASDVIDCSFSLADGHLAGARLVAGSSAATAVTMLGQFRLVNNP